MRPSPTSPERLGPGLTVVDRQTLGLARIKRQSLGLERERGASRPGSQCWTLRHGVAGFARPMAGALLAGIWPTIPIRGLRSGYGVESRSWVMAKLLAVVLGAHNIGVGVPEQGTKGKPGAILILYQTTDR